MIDNKPTIYNAPSVYNLGGTGGGGGGGVSCIRCTKNPPSTNYIEIPLLTNTRSKFELGCYLSIDSGSNNGGLFQCRGTGYYPELNMFTYPGGNFGFDVLCSQNSVSRQNLTPRQFNYHDIKIYSTDNDFISSSVDLYGNSVVANKGSQINLLDISVLRLFIGKWTGNDNMQGIEIYYFRVTDFSGNIILDLIPDEKNSIPGFTDKLSGNFYGPNVNDGTFEAVKSRQPL